MTDKEKAREIAFNNTCSYYNRIGDTVESNGECYKSAMEMAEWKDKQMWLLIDAIDYVYLQTDGSYRDLSPVVSDKIRFLKETMSTGRKVK